MTYAENGVRLRCLQPGKKMARAKSTETDVVFEKMAVRLFDWQLSIYIGKCKTCARGEYFCAHLPSSIFVHHLYYLRYVPGVDSRFWVRFRFRVRMNERILFIINHKNARTL